MSKANFCARQLEFALSSTNKDFYQIFVSADQFKTLVSFWLLSMRIPEEEFRNIRTFLRPYKPSFGIKDQKYSNSSGERTVCLC